MKIAIIEMISNRPIKCYDNGGKSFDRYTVIYLDEIENRDKRLFAARAMSASPFNAQGFGQYTSAMVGSHLGKRIAFAELPKDCQKLVLKDLE